MKKLSILLAVFLFAGIGASAQNKTMKVHRSNGTVERIPVSTIDSVTFVEIQTQDEWVEINGVKWATRNVDAPGTFVTNPEDAGMFYQWNRNIGWERLNPLVASNGSKYWDDTTPSGYTWQEANDPSPAGWRVPTYNELQTLLDTKKVEIAKITRNGKACLQFTDKTNDNFIILPLAGYRLFSSGSLNGVGSDGRYWSSTLNASDDAYYLRYITGAAISTTLRDYGYAIRPVAE